MYTINDFKAMEPMKYYDNPLPKTDGAKKKRTDIIDGGLSSQYIATRKYDGDWAMFIHYKNGSNLIRSRSISKVTGEYGDYTNKLPSLVAEMNERWPDNTVVLGELCMPSADGQKQDANTIGTILRCLPEKAIERQKKTPVEVHVFDLLMLNGEDLTQKGYETRLNMIAAAEFLAKKATSQFFLPFVVQDNFGEAADEIIGNGGEGLVLQLRNNPYMPGTRTAWKTLKLKQMLPQLELKVVGVLEPNKVYEGDCINNWKYWEVDDIMLTTLPPQQGHSLYETEGGANPIWKINHYPFRAVTKPYFMGWKNGVIVDYNGVNVSVASGLTDDDRAWLATPEAATKIASGELYAVIKAMSENSRASLRHPCLIRLRDDM